MSHRALKVASYNIHACVGTDARYDPPRIARVLDELDCHVLGLQEVDDRCPPHDGLPQFRYFQHATGMTAIDGPAIHDHRGCYGNVLLTRLAVRRARRLDLSHRAREPRGAIDAVLRGPTGPIRVIVTHLGLHPRERAEQIRTLIQALRGDDGFPRDLPTLLLGDMNEYLPTGPRIRDLKARFAAGFHRGSWPAFWPILPLDRIYSDPAPRRAAFRIHRSATARRASDHLPVKLTLRW
jgi:endonuclease/exonuclease/phosphatase family metal-dependent hydrolase